MSDERSSLRRRLQAETRDMHEALHIHPLLSPLGSDAITRDQYGKIISAFYSFYSGQEPAYAHLKNTFAEEVDLLSLLEADLRELGLPRPETSSQKAEQADLSEYLGYLYVKQGSTLGGQLIAKGIEKNLGLEKGTQQHFFYGAGAKTGPNWKAFENFIETSSNDLDHERVIKRARDCFAQMNRHLLEFRHA